MINKILNKRSELQKVNQQVSNLFAVLLQVNLSV